jgi:nitroimidazol reductase NimA-like FMN-containing flavoprotein (pyridoxamine 5'-phosphate oxidase superfamily)
VPAASAASPRTRVRRAPKRALYDRDSVEAILDAALVCHLGFTDAGGQPYVIPTLHARVGDTVYVHGSTASRMVRTLAGGAPACLTVTLVDGLVLAKSAFHHSVNYRSVVLLGTMTLVTGTAERRAALDAFVEQMIPGRTADARAANAKELKATQVLAMPLEEASAKVRTGGPVDDAEDLELPAWTGVIPLTTVAGPPLGDPEPPEYVRSWRPEPA